MAEKPGVRTRSFRSTCLSIKYVRLGHGIFAPMQIRSDQVCLWSTAGCTGRFDLSASQSAHLTHTSSSTDEMPQRGFRVGDRTVADSPTLHRSWFDQRPIVPQDVICARNQHVGLGAAPPFQRRKGGATPQLARKTKMLKDGKGQRRKVGATRQPTC